MPPHVDGAQALGRVLVVDDETSVREVVSAYLEREGYRVDQASDGPAALAALGRSPDLIILDVMLPALSGLDVLRQLRATSQVPVILLTARSDEPDRVVGLELGADDYVVKPFFPRELVARVRSVLKRSSSRSEARRLEFPGLAIDLVTREVDVRGTVVPTRLKEFDLLAFLAASPRQVFSRGQLLQHVWNASPDDQDVSTVTVHIRRVRQKIEVDPLDPRWITTVWGVGYRFEP